jgi:hypothetical protein
MKYEDDLYGKTFAVIGIVEEHLKFDHKEWVKLKFQNGSSIVINVKYCKEIDDTINRKSDK